MAKSRLINTKFWADSFVQYLDVEAKLLFLYFLTNEHTNICGIYEISIRTILFETGLARNRLYKAMDRLSSRIKYKDGWVSIKNFQKHQQNNPKVQAGIKAELSRIPTIVYDSLSIDYDSLPHLNLNLNSNLNLKNTIMSGKDPDDMVLVNKRNLKAEAIEVLEFLNEKVGKRFEPVSANLDLIMNRLKEPNISVQTCRSIIAKKFRDWSAKEDMLQYMRPATLFNKTKFWQYEGELLKQGDQNEKAVS